MADEPDAIDWALVEQVFTKALLLPFEERDTFIEAQCGKDTPTAVAVKRTLSNHKDDDFLQPPGDETWLHHLDDAEALPNNLEGHTIFGRYELGPLLGRGGSGGVYRAGDRVTGNDVAVKVMGRRGMGAIARYELASLRHLRVRGVVTLLDDGVDDELGTCLVMELVEGVPFGPAMGPLSWPDTRRIMLALLDTLARIHARGLVHKDLKPLNILVDAAGIPTVLDLGISALPHQGDAQTPALFGTPAYMAPEVARGELPDERADLHAVGLMAVEVLTGRHLYNLDHPPTLLMAKRGMLKRQVEGWLYDEHVPDEARTVLAALLAPDPEDRPLSAREARAQLEPRVGYRHPAVESGTEDGLRGLFPGTERIVRIPSDAAHEVFKRTDGVPRAVQAELDAWEGARLGHWDDDGFHIERPELEELRAGLHPRVPAEAPDLPTNDPTLDRLLPYVRALPAPVTEATLAAASQLTAPEVRTALETLLAARVVEPATEGRVRLTSWGVALPPASQHADRAGRLANAWPVGAPGRMQLLIDAGRQQEVADESLAAVETAFNEGTIHDVIRIATIGLRAGPRPPTERALLIWLLRASIPMSSAQPIEAALAQVERSSLPDGERRPLKRIASAALLGVRGEMHRARETLPGVDELRAGHEVELAKMVRIHLFRHLPPDEQEAATRSLLGSPEDADSVAACSAWAWAYLFKQDLPRAVAMFQRQISIASTINVELSARSNAAYAHLMAFQFDEANAQLAQVTAIAASHRASHFEAHAAFDRRRVAYVQGGDVPPDPDLIPIIGAVLPETFLNYARVCEAGIAWRAGAVALARTWLADTCAYLGDSTRASPDPVARAFYAYLSPDLSPDDRDSLTAALDTGDMPSDAVEAMAFMAMRDPAWLVGLGSHFRSLLTGIPRETWKFRRMVLSIDEAVKSVMGSSQL